jgi:hypothetical protein
VLELSGSDGPGSPAVSSRQAPVPHDASFDAAQLECAGRLDRLGDAVAGDLADHLGAEDLAGSDGVAQRN